jgi:ribosomal protein S18 acetylase RimI-like enzyme
VSAIQRRPAGLSAAPILAELHGSCFEWGWGAEDFAGLLRTPGTGALLACLGGVLTGSIRWRVAAAERETLSMAVHSSARHTGLGGEMLARHWSQPGNRALGLPSSR